MDTADLLAHQRFLAKRLLAGKVVPFLGAGVNQVGRDGVFAPGSDLPSGPELAKYLADYFAYTGDNTDLVRVSQFASVVGGMGPLYEKLREVFDGHYGPTELHRFLARIPRNLRLASEEPKYQVIVTTNYDDALEVAFDEAGEEYSLVKYIADGPDRGRFSHRPPNGEAKVVDRPNEYTELSSDKCSVIVKIHGAVDRADPNKDSYVITEDHYIDYLVNTNITELIPLKLLDTLRASHFLFLGYSLSDWNLRVILNRIWGDKQLGNESWAIQKNPEWLARKAWPRRGVQILDIDLGEYVTGLQSVLDELEAGIRS